jgi:hypothetical protein
MRNYNVKKNMRSDPKLTQFAMIFLQNVHFFNGRSKNGYVTYKLHSEEKLSPFAWIFAGNLRLFNGSFWERLARRTEKSSNGRAAIVAVEEYDKTGSVSTHGEATSHPETFVFAALDTCSLLNAFFDCRRPCLSRKYYKSIVSINTFRNWKRFHMGLGRVSDFAAPESDRFAARRGRAANLRKYRIRRQNGIRRDVGAKMELRRKHSQFLNDHFLTKNDFFPGILLVR